MPSEKDLTCLICNKNFKRIYSKYKHIRNVHKIETDEMRKLRKINLKCPLCIDTAPTYGDLRNHIRDSHNLKMVKEEFKFKGLQEFLKWKRNYEKQENKLYVKKARQKKTKYGGVKTQYYYCCRSGDYIPKGNNVRKLKREGSRKMNLACPSTLVVRQYKKQIDVVFWTTHAGHTEDLSDITLSKEEHALINDKLKKGVPLKKILSNLKNQESYGESRNIELTSMEDIRNISKTIWMQDQERKHERDAISVRLWIEEMTSLSTNSPIMFYKQKNETDKYKILNSEDLMIIIMIPFQKELLIKLGCSKICIDIIRKTDCRDLKLITLMVVDEFSSGFPAAYCITNRVDIVALEIFFIRIKMLVGYMHCDIFMSDDDPTLFNAWTAVVGMPNTKLLSSWNVDKNWRKNIISQIKGKSMMDVRVLIYKRLRAILCRANKENINTLLTNLLFSLAKNSDTAEFAKHFSLKYQTKIGTWAYCYRESLGENTNMHLQAFHKVLKYFLSEGKLNKRLDKFISTLLLITKSKIYERMIKFCKNKPSQKFKDIIESHKRSKLISPHNLFTLNANLWQVHSADDTTSIITYVTESKCENRCMISCSDCKICVHMYTCTCMENTIKFNICEHIHACHTYFGQQPKALNHIEEILPKNEVFTPNPVDSALTNFKSLIKDKCEKIMSASSKNVLSNEMSENVVKKLDSILSDLKETEKPRNTIKEPVKQTVIKQFLLIKLEKPKVYPSNSKFSEQLQINPTDINNFISGDHSYFKKFKKV